MRKKTLDKSLLVLTLVFTLLGVLAIADASAPQALAVFKDSFYFVKQQILWGGLGLIALLVASQIHYSLWRKTAVVFVFLSVVFLILVLIPGLGIKALGARRWIQFGSFNFQPSEFVKLAVAIYFARLADLEKPLLSYLIPLVIIAALMMLQPDFGTTLVVLCIAFAQLFVAGVNVLLLFLAVVVGGALSTVLILISEYRRQRLLEFIKSIQDPLGSSYHIRQILLAIGSGGVFGVGLGQSRQKYLFLPEAATDSVFAIIAEEIGFLGAGALIILFALFLYRGIRIAFQAPDRFSSVLAAGILAWIGGQIFLNIGSMVALIPLTGIPLPFFSYGGSSLTMVLFGVGILLNISKFQRTKLTRRRQR